MTENAKYIIKQRNARFGIVGDAFKDVNGRNTNFVNVTPDGGAFSYQPDGQIFPTPSLSSFLNCSNTEPTTTNTIIPLPDGDFNCD